MVARQSDLRAGDISVAELLRLLGLGPTVSILVALGGGPLRTRQLTDRIPGCVPRTVYRHAGKLTGIGLVERSEGPGVPSRVVYRLPHAGQALVCLLVSYAEAVFPKFADGQIDDRSWSTLGLLAELWEWGLVAELSREARSPTELAAGAHGLTFHQINRRARLFRARGLLREDATPGRRRRYELSDPGRRATLLIAGVARWRQRYVDVSSKPGLTAAEMVTVLRASLPLVRLPEHVGTNVKLGVLGSTEEDDRRGTETLLVRVCRDGTPHCREDTGEPVDGWAVAPINSWFGVILDGDRGRMRVGGKLRLVDACLIRLHKSLWGTASPSKQS
jgi:DNA-binding HxlR family transcriptional regulator